MNKYNKHTPTDIIFKYNVQKFEDLDKYWNSDNRSSGSDSSTIELLLILALFGVQNQSKIPLDTDDGKGKSRSLSRTVYSKEIVRMESIMGLIYILSEDKLSQEVVLNEMAFAKMHTHGLSFRKLPNVQNFYEYMLGGIDPLYEIIFEFGKEPGDIVAALFDFNTDDEEYLTDLVESMLLNDLLAEEDN